MPKLGSDTRKVLSEIGYSEEQIDEWISEGVVKEQLHDKYLPVEKQPSDSTVPQEMGSQTKTLEATRQNIWK